MNKAKRRYRRSRHRRYDVKTLLIFLNEATQAIAKVATVGEAKAISDQAAAIKLFAAKQGWSAEQKAKIAEIELRATVRLGELLKERPKLNGSRGAGKKVEFQQGTPLSDLGVTKKQSHLAQKAASVPEKKREMKMPRHPPPVLPSHRRRVVGATG
jgi:hypothetical protein